MWLLLAGLAFAQNGPSSDVKLNTQLWRPTIDGTPTLWTNDAAKRPHLYGSGRLVFSYMRDPFVWVYGNGTQVSMVKDAIQADVIGAVQLGPVRLGVDLPVYALATSDVVAGGGAGIGDPTLDLKATVLDPREAALGLALATRVTLPIATTGAALGEDGLGWEIEGIFDKPVGPVRFLLNVGTRIRPRTELPNVTLDDQIYGRFGLGYALSENAGLSGDVGTQANFSDALTNSAAVPLEGIVGGWGRLGASPLVLRGGVGTGLLDGIGAPSMRVIGMLSIDPPEERDRDADGILDKIDDCPNDPEDIDTYEDVDGCPDPDNDGDGLLDVRDNCPLDPEDFDEWLDSDGCPEPESPVRVRVVDPSSSPIGGASTRVSGGDAYQGGEFTIPLVAGEYTLSASADGYSDGQATVRVPEGRGTEATIQLTPYIPMGQLQIVVRAPGGERIEEATFTANGGGDIEVATEPMQMRPGRFELMVVAPGYKPVGETAVIEEERLTYLEITLEPSRVVVTKTRIDLSEKVYFDTNRATIKPESFGLLDEVARVLIDHPELLRIRVEGHTDSRGSASYNLDLSKQRAASVMQYLQDAGVAPERLESEGYGESKPLDDRQNAEAWEKNRRVDIFIVEREGE